MKIKEIQDKDLGVFIEPIDSDDFYAKNWNKNIIILKRKEKIKKINEKSNYNNQ